MSTHKHFDKICCVVLVLVLVLTVLFMNAEALGIQKNNTTMAYEEKLFDTSSVHTIDIVMEDWNSFISNCESEEYFDCTVIIDGESFKNVAIRGKGNTSLSQVSSYGNDRYSFKIEFDHYNDSNTYYGLDKLCLNNIIQDNTYMKDYLTYQMMAKMGVASPLCSYAYITVNGEDWGLYLAVEAVEDSFLARNYGQNYGELYKPDSMKMGGGRGNGKQFDMEEFMSENEDIFDFEGALEDEWPTMPDFGGGFDGNFGGNSEDGQGGWPTMPGFDGGFGGNFGGNSEDGQGEWPSMPGFGGDFGGNSEDGQGEWPSMPSFGGSQGERPNTNRGQMPSFGGTGMGSSDVLLQYIDDDADSYSNIFDNAKTATSAGDKKRLINALKNLSTGTQLEDTVDIETVIRYFVVHNFVVNFDSYTGSMIHNYYLYEEDGQMQMIPWDYNLAFGGFQSMDSATSLVNYPIDDPVSGGNTENRPMIAWIFNNEEYTELYHTIFAEFISKYFDTGYFETMFTNVTEMIAPYVEKDPTKFCTYEEFEKGIATLKEFCTLRAKSIKGQLDGSIGSKNETQDSSTLVNADHLQISDMGSMDGFMGGFKDGNFQNGQFGGPNDPNNNNNNNKNNKQPNRGYRFSGSNKAP